MPGWAIVLIVLACLVPVLGISAGFFLSTLGKAREARKAARRSMCTNQLRTFAMAVKLYENEYDGSRPPWLSNLYPRYITKTSNYICPADPTRGRDGGMPSWMGPTRAHVETDDFDGSDAAAGDPDAAAFQNSRIKGNSYLYRSCCAECSWWTPGYSWKGLTCSFEEVYRPDPGIHPGSRAVPTWGEVAAWERRHVGHHAPVIQCYWHTHETSPGTQAVLNLDGERAHVYPTDTGDGWRKGLD